MHQKQPTDGKAKASHLWAVLVKYGSIAQFTDLVLDQPPGRAGQLVHAADTGHVFAVDLCSGTGRAVLTHEHSRHPDAMRCSARTCAAVSATPAASS